MLFCALPVSYMNVSKLPRVVVRLPPREAAERCPDGMQIDIVAYLRVPRKLSEKLYDPSPYCQADGVSTASWTPHVDALTIPTFPGVIDIRVLRGLRKLALDPMDYALYILPPSIVCGTEGQPLTSTDPRVGDARGTDGM